MIEVWAIDTRPGAAGALAASAARTLGDDERRRARGLAGERERTAFIAARVALRRLLAPYDAELARGGRFLRGPNGKPRVAGGPAFNFSATTGLALVAIAERGEVGVDVEEMRDVPFAREAIARSPALAHFADASAASGDTGAALRFLRAWTRFEASIKLSGDALGPALSSLRLGEPGGIGRRGSAGAARPGATVSDLAVRHGFVAACAHAEGEPVTCRVFDWGGGEEA